MKNSNSKKVALGRFRLLGLAAALSVFAFVNSVAEGSPKPEKPNILWILTEDMGPELGCYGHPQVFTPTLDQLATDGVRYENAFTVTPVCSTSRSSFMTGMHACSIGAHQHRTPEARKKMLPEGVRVLTGWLKDEGYYTANLRKIDPDVKGTGKTDWNFQFPKKDYFDGDDWSKLKTNQPFYAQINFSESHRGWNSPHKADPSKVKLPPYYPDHPVARKDWARYLDDISFVDTRMKIILQKLEDEGMADNTIIVFMGDHGRAHVRGKQWCYDSGLRVPLIIRWAKNFPVPDGFTPGSVDERLISAIDVSATTLVTMAGAAKPAKMQGRVFLGEQRDSNRLFTFAARDRCDMTTFHIRTARDKRYRYIRNGMPERPFLQWNAYKFRVYPMIGLMQKLHAEGKLYETQAVLLQDQRPKEEFYDLKNDPYEINNLAGDPAYAGIQEDFVRVLDRWIKQVGDQGPESAEVRAPYDEMVRTQKDTRPAHNKRLLEEQHLKQKPNIVFIMADDLGYGDVGCFNPNSKAPTPNIDRLATEGVRFTHAYSPAAVCVPTRYGLLTGRYPFRASLSPNREAVIREARETIGTMLQKQGYLTGCIGKWHLGFDDGVENFKYGRPLRGGPVDRGFNYYYGFQASTDDPPYPYIENDHLTASLSGRLEDNIEPQHAIKYQGKFWRAGKAGADVKLEEVHDRLGDRAVEFLQRHHANGSRQPFFLYFPMTAPHAPWLPSKEFQGKSDCGPYGDFLMHTDHVVGQVLKTIDELGYRDNTLVIVTSDNGPLWLEADETRTGHHASYHFRGRKGDVWEGGVRMPFVARWPGKVKPGSTSD